MSDTMYVPTGNEGAWGGNGFVWAFLIFALLGFGGNGFGGRGMERPASAGDVQRGFDTNEITRKLDGVGYGLSDGFYAQNTNLLNGFAGVNNNISTEGRALQAQLAECCCNNARNVDSLRFDMANYMAQSNANTIAQVQKVLDTIQQNKIETLQQQVQTLQNQLASVGTVKYPMGMTYSAGQSPFCGSGCMV